MSLKQTVSQGFRSLLLHQLRTFLSTLGIMFGVVAVITMLSIGEGSKQEILTQIEQLGTNNVIIRQSELTPEQQSKALAMRSYGLSLADAKLLQKNIPFIQKQAALKVVKARIRNVEQEISPEILAVTPSFRDIKGLSTSEGRFLCDLDIKHHSQVCVLGSEVAAALGRKGHVGQSLRIENMQFRITGILRNKNWTAGKSKALTTRNLNKSVLIPLGLEAGFPRNHGGKNEALTEITLQLVNSDKMAPATKAIKRMMEFAHHSVEDYQIVIPQELLEQAYRTQNVFNLVLGSIAAISMLVGGIGIMNIMLASVSERTREIGIRRAVGASQRHIAKQFLIETLILTLTGAFLGLVVGVGCSHLIGFLAGWNVIVTIWSMVLSLSMAILVGVASGLYPAIKAASMDPIGALRHI